MLAQSWWFAAPHAAGYRSAIQPFCRDANPAALCAARASALPHGEPLAKPHRVKAVLRNLHMFSSILTSLPAKPLVEPPHLCRRVFAQPLEGPINSASGSRRLETYLVHSLSSAPNIDIISAASLSFSGSMS